MKKQTTITSSIIVVLIILGGLVYWSLNKNHTFYNNENINQNENENIDNLNTELDTSNWVTFEDKELGISYKHPVDCWQNGAGPGTEATNAVECGSAYLKYQPLGFGNLNIEEIANIYYKINKYNFDNPNKPRDRFISELSKKEVNNLEAYNFFFDWGFQEPCSDNYEAYCGGSVVDQTTEASFISDEYNNKKMLIIFPKSNILSEKILNTFKFINHINTNDWIIFENKTLGYSLKYDGDKYKFSKYRNIEFHDSFVSKENEETALIFYNKPMLDKSAGGATFASIKGYEYIDNKYYVFYGSGEDEYKKQEVIVLDKISIDAGEIIVIDGTKFDYGGPNIGPYDDYAAVINWNNSDDYGTSIWVSDEMISYDEFLAILKNIEKI